MDLFTLLRDAAEGNRFFFRPLCWHMASKINRDRVFLHSFPVMQPSIRGCSLTQVTPVFAFDTAEALMQSSFHQQRRSPLCVTENSCFQPGMLSSAAEKNSSHQTQKPHTTVLHLYYVVWGHRLCLTSSMCWGKAYKRANHADAEVGLPLYIFSNPLILCLTSLLQVGIPPLTSESSVSRLLNSNPVNHFHSSHTFFTLKVSRED